MKEGSASPGKGKNELETKEEYEFLRKRSPSPREVGNQRNYQGPARTLSERTKNSHPGHVTSDEQSDWQAGRNFRRAASYRGLPTEVEGISPGP